MTDLEYARDEAERWRMRATKLESSKGNWVLGPITLFRGRPEIVINDPAQVTW